MLYACDNCHYLFLRTSVDTCPDCGKAMIRPATSEEQEEYKNREKENLWTENSIAAVCSRSFHPRAMASN